ncbi:MAG: helix-turn-helix transcriptional regulator [Rhodoferax sp.]|nr:helix-turn-helix transcriptional regulator [Rhodoferax sp.]
MKRTAALKPQLIENTDPVAPTPGRPVRSRARSLVVDAHFEPHCHPWAQVAYCASGLIEVTVADGDTETTFILPPSRAVWIPPGARHAVTMLEATELRTVYLDPTATPQGWQGCRVLVISSLLRELIHALEASQPCARDDALIALTLFEITHADTQALGVPLPRDKRLRTLCEAVLRAPGKRATLSEWAVDIGASERTVARLFRTGLATSFQQWRQQAILAHALPMLARGTPISQVAAASGYASDSAFSAMFKSAMGHSPSHFQNKNVL